MKKKVVAAIMSVALVAAVGIGGTLAYLSAQSEVVNNTFTVGTGYTTDKDGHKGIYIDEADIDSSNPQMAPRVTKNVYKDMVPGKTYIKDPRVHLVGGSIASYVFVKVDGLSDLAEKQIHVQYKSSRNEDGTFNMTTGVNKQFYRLLQADGTDGDGIYLCIADNYVKDSKKLPYVNDVSNLNEGGDSPLPYIFDEVKMDSDVTTDEFDNITIGSEAIKIQAAAVQYSPDEMDSFVDAGASLPKSWGAKPETWQE